MIQSGVSLDIDEGTFVEGTGGELKEAGGAGPLARPQAASWVKRERERESGSVGGLSSWLVLRSGALQAPPWPQGVKKFCSSSGFLSEAGVGAAGATVLSLATLHGTGNLHARLH